MNIFKNILKKVIYSNDITKYLFVKLKIIFFKPNSQSNESEIITHLINKFNINKIFLEIGFSPWEFNCADIVKENSGYIIDADNENIKIGKWMFSKINFIHEFIDLENIDRILSKINQKIDILSLDIDGNDYYIMKRLLILNPSLIICEYNPAYHLRPICSIYKKDFDRTKEQDQWLYYGCSIKGWEILMKKNGYLPVAISNSGVNVFFIKENLINETKDVIDINKSFVDYNWPDNLTHEDQWEKIKNMDYKNIN